MKDFLSKKDADMTIGDNLLLALIAVAFPALVMFAFGLVVATYRAAVHFAKKLIQKIKDTPEVLESETTSED